MSKKSRHVDSLNHTQPSNEELQGIAAEWVASIVEQKAIDEAQMAYLKRFTPLVIVTNLCWLVGKSAGLVGLVAWLVAGPGELTSICLGFLLLGGVAQVAFYIAITPGFIRETNRVKQEMGD